MREPKGRRIKKLTEAWIPFSLNAVFLPFLLGFVVLSFASASLQDEPETAVHFDFRSLHPGEVLKVSLKDPQRYQTAFVRVFERKFSFAAAVDTDELITLVGIDLDQKEGEYPLQVTVQHADGRTEVIRRRLFVEAREFPEDRLWVDERYVTPPSSVLDRIQRESVILSSLFSLLSPVWMAEGPFIVPVEGKAANNFGERRFFNNKPRSPHSGEDISAPAGTAVAASNSGRVVLASELYYSGNTVIIDHGLGVYTFTCHFSRILAKRGQTVKKGDVIGEVGATGRVTGPHLHWSVRVNGGRVDPYSLLYLKF
ncbi:MAG: M23 family metallopeptidase [Acidobacteria bacterium]|nr:M23 family metallopeptidase [Acidobacteriota bacterium]